MTPKPAPDRDDAVLRRAFVSVQGEARLVGAGVLISPRQVLTCAHVINSALGRDRFAALEPSRRQPVALRLPHIDPDRVLTGRVVPGLWRPPRSRPTADHPSPPPIGMLPYYGDVAVLELDGDAPRSAEPAPFLTARSGNEVVAQWASGHALSTLRAVPRASAHPWIALDVLGGKVVEGFSGGPLWDRERQAVVGLIVAAHETSPEQRGPAPAMYAIGLSSIEAELPALPPVDVPAGGRGRQQLLTTLETLLPSRRHVRECEELLAARLHRCSAGVAADVEQLAGLAMGVRRGVPELLGIVYDQLAEHRPNALIEPGGWKELLRVARIVSPRECLAQARRRNLDALLARCHSIDPGALLNRVLPYADELPVPCDLSDAMDVLEGYAPVPGQPMPPLFQAVVHVAESERAVDVELAHDLDAWVRSAAPRHGVTVAAVDQFRADARTVRPARTASKLRMAPPRVQVELLPVGPGKTFMFQIWVWSEDGRHEMVLAQDTEVTSHQVVEAIRQVLRTAVREDPETALVEFFVAPAWLRLEVDTWEFPGGPDDDGFHPGLARRVVLRSSERTRETYAGWKRRSSTLSTAPRLLLDQRSTDPLVAQARLEISPQTGIVVVCCERQQQGRVLRQCIQAGVHTVLWHREAHDAQTGADLLSLVEECDPAHIPEAIRLERNKAIADPDCSTHHGRWLSLLHDGPDHRPPPLAPDPWTLTRPASRPHTELHLPQRADTSEPSSRRTDGTVNPVEEKAP